MTHVLPRQATSKGADCSAPGANADHELVPFRHQVGGHHGMLKVQGTQWVYKTLNPMEFAFYQSITLPEHSTLLPFVPKCDGIKCLPSDCLPSAHCFGDAPAETDCGTPSTTGDSESHASAAPRPGPGAANAVDAVDASALDKNAHPPHGCLLALHGAFGVNPYLQRVHNEDLKRICASKDATSAATGGIHQYLVLEDLTSRFQKPCVLDLKMGVRVYGDDASAEKRQRHIEKARETTSHVLGVRICGSQTYRVDTDSYVYRDKYYGRRLDAEQAWRMLCEFFHNGLRMRFEVVARLLESLRALRSGLERVFSYRFYSASLLLLYEGAESEPAIEPAVDVRMIDFAHTTYCPDGPDAFTTPDAGYLLGLRNLECMLGAILEGSRRVPVPNEPAELGYELAMPCLVRPPSPTPP